MVGKEGLEIASNSLLSRDVVLAHMKAGNIVIDPFVPENLGTVSYDITLWAHYYRENKPSQLKTIYSPYSDLDISDVWGRPRHAEGVDYLFSINGVRIPGGISPKDQVILIDPGETILAHSKEFIGGQNVVTTMMKARSSIGRNFISVCKCAGWGDVGYINRWTMEITNNSRYYTIPLVVGRRIAQIAFFQVDPITGDDYTKKGKYQGVNDIEEVKKNWHPEQMLPKMWKDREVQEAINEK